MGGGVDRGALVLGWNRTQVENRDGPSHDLDGAQAWVQTLEPLAREQLADWLRYPEWRDWAIGAAGMDFWFYVFQIRVVAVPLAAIGAVPAVPPCVLLRRQ